MGTNYTSSAIPQGTIGYKSVSDSFDWVVQDNYFASHLQLDLPSSVDFFYLTNLVHCTKINHLSHLMLQICHKHFFKRKMSLLLQADPSNWTFAPCHCNVIAELTNVSLFLVVFVGTVGIKCCQPATMF